MSWGTIDLSEVSTDGVTLPEEVFNFELVKAKPNNFDENKIDVNAKVISEGPFKGERVWFSYPDPDTYKWSPQLVARLAKNMSIKIESGETALEFLNRAAGLGGKFSAPMQHRVVEKDGLPTTKSEVNIMKVRRVVA
jgi:hypothetical protein